MKIVKITQLSLMLCLSVNLVFSQTLKEKERKTEQIERYKTDEKVKLPSDTLLIKEIIRDIERSVNSFNPDKIIRHFADNKKEKSKEKELLDSKESVDISRASLNTKKQMFSNSFSVLQEDYINNDVRSVDSIKIKSVFKVSNINLTIQNSTTIVANLDVQLIDYKHNEKNDKTFKLSNDNWVFEKVLGEWKLVSCDNFMKAVNDVKTNKNQESL